MELSYFAIIIGAIFVNNVVLAQFLGICPFLGVSSKVETSMGMGAAVTFVMAIAAVVAWLIQTYVLVPLDIVYMQTIVFILVIAALVQRGAKVDQLSANDLSPLMLAVKMNNKANVEALLAAGASVNLSNKAGYTAIGYSRAGEVRQLLLAQHAELKGQAAHMAQSELQFCANAFADKLAYSDIARAVNNDTRPDIMRHQQSCPELGELTMLLGEFTFTPAGATYLGEPVTCKVSEYRKTFEVNCR